MDIPKFALIMWLPIALLVMHAMGPARGGTFAMVGAALFLPNRVGFDFQGVPPIGKLEMASIATMLGAMLYYPTRLSRIRIGLGVDLLVVVLLLGGVGTALTNADVLVYGPRVIPGMTRMDGLSSVVRDLLSYGMPFVLGRALVRTRSDMQGMLRVLAICALFYSLLVLIELRMAPQIHSWVYGFKGSWTISQHFRYGGYRPLVFLPHGLAVSAYLAVGTISLLTLAQTPQRVLGQRPQQLWPYLAIVLYLSKSLASIVYGVVSIVLIRMVKPRVQIQIAAALAAVVLLYPASRILEVFPTDEIANAAGMVNETRADSLRYRFDHEALLLEKANERILLGWGGYNRNRVFDEVYGGSITVTDGAWVIYLGSRGIVGALAFFGLLTLPIVVAQRRFERLENREEQQLIAGFALIVVFGAVDLLINGLFTHWPLFFAGALLGATQHMTSPAALRERSEAARSQSPAALEAEPPAEALPVGFATTNPERPASLGAARRMR